LGDCGVLAIWAAALVWGDGAFVVMLIVPGFDLAGRWNAAAAALDLDSGALQVGRALIRPTGARCSYG
jgi:hypothetical protein